MITRDEAALQQQLELAAPRWRLTSAQGACSVCGFLAGSGEHYEHVEHGEVHCVVCHRLGHDWAAAGDSEGSPAALEVSRRVGGLVVRIAAAQRELEERELSKRALIEREAADQAPDEGQTLL